MTEEKRKYTINNQEFFWTEEEFEDFAQQLRDNGFYVSSISYDFGESAPFTENVALVGNTKEWPELKERFPTLDRIRIEYNTVGQNHLYLYEKDSDKHIAIGYMTFMGIEVDDN